jgi:hypothetical protein
MIFMNRANRTWVNFCLAISRKARLLCPQKLPPLSSTRAAAKGGEFIRK